MLEFKEKNISFILRYVHIDAFCEVEQANKTLADIFLFKRTNCIHCYEYSSETTNICSPLKPQENFNNESLLPNSKVDTPNKVMVTFEESKS